MAALQCDTCSECWTKCVGFFTDREQRKIWGMGILYLLGFPICLLMIVVGSLRAVPPGEENPDCPAEPNMPWFLIIGGSGIILLLLIRIAINKCFRCLKNNRSCCDEVTGCFCEFGCNMMYDIFVMVLIVLWMITVTWWVFRHRISEQLYSVLGQENLDSFRYSLGDNDTIHNVQFTDPQQDSYCERLLYEVAFALLSAGWLILLVAALVFLIGKVCYSLVCCRICRNLEGHSAQDEEKEEEIRLNPNSDEEKS